MSITMLKGDCRELLDTMPEASVQCCVTSPPYFGLRDYGVAGQIGLELTPDEYIAEMVAVFRKVRRVLRDDGTLWLNLGDSYSVRHVGRRDHGTGSPTSRLGPNKDGLPGGTEIKADGNRLVSGYKPKDLLMIPARVALALQADGWWLRSDVIWHKPNPMPESITDRPTCAHEHVFLLTKSPRYFYDANAIREQFSESSIVRLSQNIGAQAGSLRANGGAKMNGPMKAVSHVDKQRGHSRRHAGFNDRWDAMAKSEQQANGANARNVWTIATAPYSEAHFATFPPALAERCIKAGTRFRDTVLDPFGGAGTTGLVADRLQRDAILIELNSIYVRLARKRIATDRGPISELLDHPPPAHPVQESLL
ncbi:DNA-methyltransferase [Acidocella facilis]|uniref:DNA-methyltransferase n=1 Tax=Acidocella facilis TaxID=525 RepID=UPI001F47B1C6|nr:site-specific DNA-methyltransferase [Acidocella facilis]